MARKQGHSSALVKMTAVGEQRKSLQTIQMSAKGQKKLVGRDEIETTNKKVLSGFKVFEDQNDVVKICQKNANKKNSHLSKSEGTQTENVLVLDPVEMITSDSTTPEYYLLLAEQRRTALQKTLEENMNLHNLVRSLQEELKIVKEERDLLKPLADEAKNLAALLKVLTEDEETLVNEEEEELAVPLENGD